MNEVDVGYVAGFFEGEGSASVFRRRSGRSRGIITIVQKDPTALHWMQEKLQMGFVFERGGPAWRFRIARQSDVRRFIRLIYPHVKAPEKRNRLRAAYNASRR